MHYLDYNENKTHGTDLFPLEFYHVDASHPRYAMPYHWHSECEIIRILQGSFAISLNSRELLAQAGDVIFIRDGVVHGGTPRDCVYECIVFDIHILTGGSEGCRDLVRPIKDHHRKILPLVSAAADAGLSQAIDRLFTIAAQFFPGRELCVSGCLAEFLGHLYRLDLFEKNDPRPAQDVHKMRQKMEQLRSVLRYIEANYADAITLSQLSAQAGMTPKYFCRFFESIVHKTPMEYLNYYRIERACCLLADTDASVTEVGYDCGFHDTSYFIRVFKREKGITPRKYQSGEKPAV